VKNFEENHVAGSIILNFSDAEWKDLIPSMGFRKFVCQALKTKETTCHQEMLTVFWNTSKQKSSAAVQSKPTVKDMPSKLLITSFFATPFQTHLFQIHQRTEISAGARI
jgi:hypothetical protein